jgi:hypothetical protein
VTVAVANYWDRHGAGMAARGWKAVPIAPGDKKPGGWNGETYTGLHRWQGFGVPTLTEVAERAAWPACPGTGAYAGVGMVLGVQGDGTGSFVVGLDIDIRDAGLADAVETLALERFGATCPVRFGQRPKRAMLCRCSETTGKLATAGYRLPGEGPNSSLHRVEVLAEGQQVVAYGRHPTGVDYAWRDGRGPDAFAPGDLPIVTLAGIRGFLAACDSLLIAAGGVPVSKPVVAGTGTAKATDGNSAHRAGVRALVGLAGLVLRERAGGVTDIRCPFGHPERADEGAALLSGGGVKCHHTTCEGRAQGDFERRLRELVTDAGQDAERVYEAAARVIRLDMAQGDFRAADKPVIDDAWNTLASGRRLTPGDVKRLALVPGTRGRGDVNVMVRAAGVIYGANVKAILRRIARARNRVTRDAHRVCQSQRQNAARAACGTPVPGLPEWTKPVPLAEAQALMEQGLRAALGGFTARPAPVVLLRSRKSWTP